MGAGERFTIALDEAEAEFVRDYRYAKIKDWGEIDYTIRDVFIEAVKSLKKTTTIEISPRPEFVKVNEDKKRKKKGQAILDGKKKVAARK